MLSHRISKCFKIRKRSDKISRKFTDFSVFRNLFLTTFAKRLPIGKIFPSADDRTQAYDYHILQLIPDISVLLLLSKKVNAVALGWLCRIFSGIAGMFDLCRYHRICNFAGRRCEKSLVRSSIERTAAHFRATSNRILFWTVSVTNSEIFASAISTVR